MRLFIGLPFDCQTQRRFLSLQENLQRHAEKGNFTSLGNFHLTLAFLGETEESRLPGLFSSMEKAPLPPMELVFDRLDFFDGGILYLAPAFCPALMDGQTRLARVLQENGFLLEDRPYIPHLTLGRGVLFEKGYTPSHFLPAPIAAFSQASRLFLSHRAEGQLRYDILFPAQKSIIHAYPQEK